MFRLVVPPSRAMVHPPLPPPSVVSVDGESFGAGGAVIGSGDGTAPGSGRGGGTVMGGGTGSAAGAGEGG